MLLSVGYCRLGRIIGICLVINPSHKREKPDRYGQVFRLERGRALLLEIEHGWRGKMLFSFEQFSLVSPFRFVRFKSSRGILWIATLPFGRSQ